MVAHMIDLPVFVDPDLCGPCGGKCCKHYPGIAYPEDFGLPDVGRLWTALLTRLWVVDWWEGDPRTGFDEYGRVCFVRPAMVGSIRWPEDPAWVGSPCVFLGPGGCILSLDERPRGCCALEPLANSGCLDHSGGKLGAAMAWLPYQHILSAVVSGIQEVVR